MIDNGFVVKKSCHRTFISWVIKYSSSILFIFNLFPFNSPLLEVWTWLPGILGRTSQYRSNFCSWLILTLQSMAVFLLSLSFSTFVKIEFMFSLSAMRLRSLDSMSVKLILSPFPFFSKILPFYLWWEYGRKDELEW